MTNTQLWRGVVDGSPKARSQWRSDVLKCPNTVLSPERIAAIFRLDLNNLFAWQADPTDDGPPFMRIASHVLYNRKSVADWVFSIEKPTKPQALSLADEGFPPSGGKPLESLALNQVAETAHPEDSPVTISRRSNLEDIAEFFPQVRLGEMPDDNEDESKVYLPEPEVIAAMCAEIRATWSSGEHRKRLAGHKRSFGARSERQAESVAG